jgi:hypothetical protein
MLEDFFVVLVEFAPRFSHIDQDVKPVESGIRLFDKIFAELIHGLVEPGVSTKMS